MRAKEPTPPRAPRTTLTDNLGWLGLRSGQILLVIALAAVLIYGMVQLKLVVIPVLLAIILAAALSPIVSFLRRRGLAAILATWITLLAVIGILGGIITLIVFAVQDQFDELAVAATDGIDELIAFVTQGPIPINEEQINGARDAVVDFVTSSQFGTGALAGATAVIEVLTSAVLLIVILFFFLKDGDKIWEFFLKPFGGERLARGRRIGKTSIGVLGGYVRGTAIIAFVDALFIGIGLTILQVPLALPLAVIVFLGAFIPLIGATLAGVLAALVALVASGPVIALIVIIIVVAVNQLEGNLLQPVVMAQSLNLHPLVILVALTGGTIVGGIVGAVVAVPIAAVVWAIAKVWNREEVALVARPPRRSRKK
ncbi:AI-2E family transporter [Cryobacterium frigoriphilum]|uniref:AI-2E family transporter n=1 Tax=Cryobacterium frigoriphilum TaxID=1259150 RepID=A0A4R8ZY61_9MICO|nr:AI-2E family transporter [Cryobacterium frigoriphilum]TFD48816.1 AI-2E family transporter [Cryobacterium frigoriphilum]